MLSFNILKNCGFAVILAAFSPSLAAAQDDYDSFEHFRFGSYGEAVANFRNYDSNRFGGQPSGADSGRHNFVSLPHFSMAFDYKFNPRWVLGTEIEVEAGGVGVETELEASENGEYETEMEQGGEVAIEQLHITRIFSPAFNIRAGHMVVPLGLTNTHHEPINYYGCERPEGETTFIPSTWHETGVSIFGSLGAKGSRARVDYEAMVVTGLNPDGFGRDHWVQGGKQGLFERDNFSCPAYAARLDYRGVDGLRLGASAYFCPDPARNSDKSNKYSRYTASGKNAVTIVSADGSWQNRYITARANVIYGTLAHSDVVSSVTMSNKSGYQSGAMRRVAHSALTYSCEAGLNVRSFFSGSHTPDVRPYVHYEYFNPQQTAEGSATVDPRTQVSKWQAGLNWYILPNLVAKVDYSNRRIGTQRVFGYSGTYNRENEIRVGFAFIGWWVKK